ncbi:MAG: STAS domain-containing protein [Jatrophihabitantaceae bacterium]
MDFSVSTRTEDDTTIVAVTGDIDLYTSPRLQEQLAALIDSGASELVVDLSNVPFLDSTALGALVGARKDAMERGGSITLAGAQNNVVKVLRVTKLTEVFAMHDSVADALSATH